jgi:hypothetical protein
LLIEFIDPKVKLRRGDYVEKHDTLEKTRQYGDTAFLFDKMQTYPILFLLPEKKGTVSQLFLSQIISGLKRMFSQYIMYYFNVLIMRSSPEKSKLFYFELCALLTTRKLFSQTVLDRSLFIYWSNLVAHFLNLPGWHLHIHLFILAAGGNSILLHMVLFLSYARDTLQI